MRLSRLERWSWLASALLTLTVGLVLGAKVEASHFGLPRYPANGFHYIADGSAVTYYIPASQFVGTAFRQAHSNWNVTRNGGYLAYAVETTLFSNWQQIEWQRLDDVGAGYATQQNRGSVSYCINTTVGDWCRVDVVVDDMVPEEVGSAAHELGHALFGLANEDDESL